MLRWDVNYHALSHCSVFLRPWWDTFNLRVTQMSALNLSPTFPEGSSPTWIMTSRFRRRGFVHKRLYLCRRGTNLARHSLFFFFSRSVFLFKTSPFSQIWDDITGFHPITFSSHGTRFRWTTLLTTPLSEYRFNWQPDPFVVTYSWPVRWHGCQPSFSFLCEVFFCETYFISLDDGDTPGGSTTKQQRCVLAYIHNHDNLYRACNLKALSLMHHNPLWRTASHVLNPEFDETSTD